ncbi:MAG: GNAT family N-acetyltransferase [Phycisphaerae bacterium]|nr:GNAT family N-acetyltransferase [Phycisphaerae bacterium]
MTLLPKNRHISAAVAILGNKRRAAALLAGLESKAPESFHFIANQEKNITEAVLLLHNAGSTTTILATKPTGAIQADSISSLIVKGLQFAATHSSNLAQTIMGTQEPLLRQAFEGAGFCALSTLTSMECAVPDTIRSVASPHNLKLTTMQHCTDKELESILIDSYIGSLDCPIIHGIRLITDIIAGHRDVLGYDANLWNIAKIQDEPTGVLLLNPVPEARCMELAYLGVSPKSRGSGLGDTLMHTAFELTKRHGLTKITLAVDSLNTPAIELYKRWNFQATAQRFTMIKKLF